VTGERASQLAALLQRPGRWTTVYLDMSADRETQEGLVETRRRSVQDKLLRSGASEAAANRVDEVLAVPTGLPGPMSRYLLLRDDELELDELLAGDARSEQVVAVGPLPQLTPLLKHQLEEFPYLVVELSRDGGDIALHRTGSIRPEATETVQGRTDTIKKFRGGGWSHLRFQHHVEAVWKQNQSEFAAEVDRLVAEHHPRLIVVSGDVHAWQLLLGELAEATKPLVVVFPRETRAPGAEDSPLLEFIEEQVERVLDREQHDALDVFQARIGRGDGTAEQGIGQTVHALQQAQVDTLFVDPAALGDRTLLALAEQPWVATAPEESLGAAVIETVPATEALVRAALLTDATVRFVGSGVLGSEVAALLRWPARVTTTS
jgi:Bacterial archaeo-eukaryotic release factor family 2